MAHVEQLLGGLDDRRDDPRLADDTPAREHGAATHPLRDLPQLERELGCAGQGVAPLVHRGRAGMGGLAAPDDPVALDAEGAEHRTQRKIHRLQHRSLLDMQLEIGGGILELAVGLESAVEVDSMLVERLWESDAVAVCQLAQLVLI